MIALVLGRQLVAVMESQSLTARLNLSLTALEAALQRWKDVPAVREILIQQAPVGIGRLGGGGVSTRRSL